MSQAQVIKTLAEDLIKQAKQKGATQAEVGISQSQGFESKVRLGEVDTITFNRDQSINIEVYFGQQKGAASSSDLCAASVEEALQTACSMARVAQADEYAGLADASDMAQQVVDCDLHHPWDIDPAGATALATQCEQAALGYDKKISNSEGADVSCHSSFYVYANSHGFLGAYPTSKHSVSCVVIGQDKENMQRDYWYDIARDAAHLQSAQQIGERAAQRTLQRLGARRVKTQKTPVIFAAEIANSLISHFLGAISGGSLYRKASFLCDQVGQKIFPDFMQIHEAPHLKQALGSAPFDSEGVATRSKAIIENGVLQTYLLGSYAARKLNLHTTGNASGVHNCLITSSELDRAGLMQAMGQGLLVTELFGQGVNLISGDFSRGAAGYWVENGVIQYPVHEITLAGNLRDMFAQVRAVGNDVDKRHNIQTGSLWVDNLMLAGE